MSILIILYFIYCRIELLIALIFNIQYCLSVWQSHLGSITFMHVVIHVFTKVSLQIMFLLLGAVSVGIKKNIK